MGVVIVRLKEAQRDNPQTFCDYRQCKLVIRQDMEVDWSPLDMLSTSILEILVPNDVLEVKYAVPSPRGPIQRDVLLQHNPQVCKTQSTNYLVMEFSITCTFCIKVTSAI